MRRLVPLWCAAVLALGAARAAPAQELPSLAEHYRPPEREIVHFVGLVLERAIRLEFSRTWPETVFVARVSPGMNPSRVRKRDPDPAYLDRLGALPWVTVKPMSAAEWDADGRIYDPAKPDAPALGCFFSYEGFGRRRLGVVLTWEYTRTRVRREWWFGERLGATWDIVGYPGEAAPTPEELEELRVFALRQLYEPWTTDVAFLAVHRVLWTEDEEELDDPSELFLRYAQRFFRARLKPVSQATTEPSEYGPAYKDPATPDGTAILLETVTPTIFDAEHVAIYVTSNWYAETRRYIYLFEKQDEDWKLSQIIPNGGTARFTQPGNRP